MVAGDISPLRAEKALKKYFTVARSKPSETTSETFPSSSVSTTSKDSFSIITLPDKASVDTFWGAVPGISKLHPDFIPLTVALQILGGGFMSRLMQEIREKRGLTYGVYTRLSGFEGGLSGYWYIWATFAPQVFGEGVAQVERVIREFITAVLKKFPRYCLHYLPTVDPFPTWINFWMRWKRSVRVTSRRSFINISPKAKWRVQPQDL